VGNTKNFADGGGKYGRKERKKCRIYLYYTYFSSRKPKRQTSRTFLIEPTVNPAMPSKTSHPKASATTFFASGWQLRHCFCGIDYLARMLLIFAYLARIKFSLTKQ
jgi:hypothetical protein